jgi:Ca2+-binding RTX toxin-like protein
LDYSPDGPEGYDYGSDTLHGGAGDDDLVGITNPDDEYGPFPDVLSYSDAPLGVRIDVATGVARSYGRDTFRGFEGYHGSIYDDVLIGTSRDESFAAFRGDDIIYGRAGFDVVSGGDGNDRIYGHGGIDWLSPGRGRDVVSGGAHPDGERHFADFVVYYFSEAGVVVDLGNGYATGEGEDRIRGIEHIQGSRHADVLRGDGSDNEIFADEGDDRLVGRGGDDRLIAWRGRDVTDGGGGTDGCWGSERRTDCERP